MGVTIESPNYSIDLGPAGFNRLRQKVAGLTATDIAEHYSKLTDGMFLVGDERQKFMACYNKKIAAQQNAETQAIQNQTNIDKAKADAEAKVTAAQGDADAKVIAAQAEADANAKINSSITDQLIRMKEAEARLKHGWVTVQGSDTVVTKDADKDSE